MHLMYHIGKDRQGRGEVGVVLLVSYIFGCAEFHRETGHVQLLSGSRSEQERTDREVVVEVCYGPPVLGKVVDVTY